MIKKPITIKLTYALFFLAFIALCLTLLTGIFIINKITGSFDRYRKVESTVNTQELEKQGFSKIESENISMYIPASWQKLDKNKERYSDVIFGSELNVVITDRTLGNMTNKLCKALAKQKVEASKETGITLLSNKVIKLGDYNGCLIESKFTKEKDFIARDFIIFRKDKIYTTTCIFQEKINTERQTSDTIFKSIVIKE